MYHQLRLGTVAYSNLYQTTLYQATPPSKKPANIIPSVTSTAHGCATNITNWHRCVFQFISNPFSNLYSPTPLTTVNQLIQPILCTHMCHQPKTAFVAITILVLPAAPTSIYILPTSLPHLTHHLTLPKTLLIRRFFAEMMLV